MRIVKIAALLLVILVVAAVAAPFLIPVDTMKGAVIAKIERVTGRKVRMGKITLSVFPNIALEAEDVKIGNPDWAGAGDMADIKELRLGVALIPLLHKQVQVKSFVLEDPVITLIKNGDKANWQLEPQAANSEPAKPAATAAPAQDTSSGVNVALPGHIAIKSGRLTYQDAGAVVQDISDINVDFKATDPEKEATLSGSAAINGEKGDITLTLANPLALMQGKASEGEMKFAFGPLILSWQGTVAYKNAKPALTGTVNIPQLDTTAFKTASPAKTSAAPAEHASSTPATSGHWSDAPINLAGLDSATANLTVKISELILPKTTFKDIEIKAHLAKGALIVSTNDIAAYGGTVKFAFGVNTGHEASFAGAVNNVKAEPLLHDFAGYDKLEGTLQGQVALSTSGNSEHAMIEALSGKGDFEVKDGVWKGKNILAMARGVGGAFGEGSNEATVFSECSGTYTIAGGVVSNKDLVLTSPQLHVSGQGTANLPGWHVQYLLSPRLVADASDTAGITVPIRIEGPLDHPGYRPDLQAALKENLKDPKAVGNTIKKLKNNLMNGSLGGLLR